MRRITITLSLLSLLSVSTSTNSDSPVICDLTCIQGNKGKFYDIYANGLGWLTLQGEANGPNTVIWQDTASLSISLADTNAVWIMFSGNPTYMGGAIIQSENHYQGLYSNLEPSCDNTKNLSVVQYDYSTSTIDGIWTLGLNSDGTNWLLNTKNCTGGKVASYLSATADNPKGSLVFWHWDSYKTETTSAIYEYETVTQGAPIVSTLSSGVGTSTSTSWIYITQPVTQTTTIASTTIFTTLPAAAKRRDTTPTIEPLSTSQLLDRREVFTFVPTWTSARTTITVQTTVAIPSGTITSTVPSSLIVVTATSTSIVHPLEMQTVMVSSMTATITPSATPKSSGMSTSDKIAIGVGLGIGIPSLLIAIVTFWLQCIKHLRSR